jgi:hypothetical protein
LIAGRGEGMIAGRFSRFSTFSRQVRNSGRLSLSDRRIHHGITLAAEILK